MGRPGRLRAEQLEPLGISNPSYSLHLFALLWWLQASGYQSGTPRSFPESEPHGICVTFCNLSLGVHVSLLFFRSKALRPAIIQVEGIRLNLSGSLSRK